MKTKRENFFLRLLVACSCAGTIAGFAALGRAAEATAPQSLKKIVIGYSGISPSQAPAWVAYEAGIFR